MVFQVLEFFGAMFSLAISMSDMARNQTITHLNLLFLVLSLAFTAGFVWQEARYHRVRKNKNMSSDKFFRYMANQIKTSRNAKVYIVSDGLSWARDERVLEALCGKKDGLTVLMRARNKQADALAAAGVEIIEYGGQAPVSRFTLIESSGKSVVLVGWLNEGSHEVWRYEGGNHPFVNTAQDIVDCLKSRSQARSAAD
ncbi:hypothetical protein [Novosphingobium capsulatum]|uniref:hypothetical protein n=1 Tax=Novosphingobium capsulatum TaxID=13688 RepID=UPI002E12C3B8|nr:hypothetical protein U0041_03720 [Novosphingobium capsulatum]